MIILKFENYNYKGFEEISLSDYFKYRKKDSVIIKKEELIFIIKNINATLIELEHEDGSKNIFGKGNLNTDNIKKDTIKIIFNYNNSIYKDSDDWYWLRIGKKAYKCDEFFGLKNALKENNYLS